MEHSYPRSTYIPPLCVNNRTTVPQMPRIQPVHPSEVIVESIAPASSRPQVVLPPLSSFTVHWPQQSTEFRDLSKISRAELNLPEDEGFKLSPTLQRMLRRPNRAVDIDEILHRVYKEARTYAESRKELVRNEMKRKLLEVRGTLTAREKGKLRSRREAKVHRVKEQHLEKALRNTIKWFITESPSGACSKCTSCSP